MTFHARYLRQLLVAGFGERAQRAIASRTCVVPNAVGRLYALRCGFRDASIDPNVASLPARLELNVAQRFAEGAWSALVAAMAELE